MKYLFTLTIVLLSIHSVAQERAFYGRVIDKDTKKGIPYCMVKARDRNEGVYTDEQGKFSFTSNLDSAKIFLFYCLGYGKIELPANKLSRDSILVEMQKESFSLKEVTVKKGKKRTDYIGMKKAKHHGDCYQKYGEEDAVFLKADPAKNGILQEVYLYITDEGVPDTKFRIHVYTKDPVTNLPATELTDSNIIVGATKGNEWVMADLSNKWIDINEGVYISVEWIAGHGNTDKSMQSVKHADVNNHNGQVLGLTKNSWKGKAKVQYMYHRDAFHNEWVFNYNPLYCPMIYAKYIYYKS
jgi:hypothetical protein